MRALAAFLALFVVTTVAAPAEPEPRAGMVCTVVDGWWSLDPKRPEQPEPVRVVVLQGLPSGEPGAWVQPLRGKLTGYQYHISRARLTACRG